MGCARCFATWKLTTRRQGAGGISKSDVHYDTTGLCSGRHDHPSTQRQGSQSVPLPYRHMIQHLKGDKDEISSCLDSPVLQTASSWSRSQGIVLMAKRKCSPMALDIVSLSSPKRVPASAQLAERVCPMTNAPPADSPQPWGSPQYHQPALTVGEQAGLSHPPGAGTLFENVFFI